MYNSRYLSRSTRTLQRRKVDTGITIDPTKVQAYKNYLLNNGYVQLPRPPCPPVPPPDGTYLFTSNADYNVSNLMSQQLYADDFISSVLSTQNISLTGTETVYIELQTSFTVATGYICKIIIAVPSSASKFDAIEYASNRTSLSLTLAFIYCNGQYSIVLRQWDSALNDPPAIANRPTSETRSFVYFGVGTSSATFGPSKVTTVAVGIE